MAIAESGNELPNLKIEIENDLDEAMETDDNENNVEYKNLKDNCPEEGELSDSKDTEGDAKVPPYVLNVTSHETGWDREKRYENKGGAFVTGVDIFDKEEQSKLHERAKRFGLDPSDVKPVTEQQIIDLYKSLGVKDEEGTEKHLRLNAIHVRGTEDMSTQDIFNYFKDYGPASIEWINDYSCNVVWLDNLSAARAMLGLSKHIKGLEEFHAKADPFLKEGEKEKGSDKENEKEEIVIVQEIEEPDGDDIIMVMERSSSFISETKTTDKVENESEMNVDSEEVQASDITVPIPPGNWRIGIPHSKARCILLRFSTRGDKKRPQAEKMSEYYKKYGNPNYGGIKGIITQSRKRRYQRQEHSTKVFEDDQGDERDFSEPSKDVKNPWGNLAKSWSTLDKTRSRRRSDVSAMEASLRTKPVLATVLHEDEQHGISVLHQIRRIEDTPVEYESEDSVTSTESDKEPDWTKRSKIPRMRMYADEEEIRIERRKAHVQAQTRRCSRSYRGREIKEERTSKRRRDNRERPRLRSHSADGRSKLHDSFERNEDDLRSRLEREGKSKLKGSIVEPASTLWDRLKQHQSDEEDDDDGGDVDNGSVKQGSESASESGHQDADDNLDNFADLRGSLLQGRKNNSRFDDGDLRSKLNFKKTMRQNVPAQKSPLRIEIDNDEYYRLIGSDQE